MLLLKITKKKQERKDIFDLPKVYTLLPISSYILYNGIELRNVL